MQNDFPLSPTNAFHQSRVAIFLLWFASLGLLLAFIGEPAVSRTQEARVLETSRQMIGRGWHDWLIPQLNGEPRLRKPPLTYWTTALAYKIGGVSEGVGRVPSAIFGWLTLAAVYLIARKAFDFRTAMMAVACLLGSYLFFRHNRLDETDSPATLFVTVAIGALWHAMQTNRARWFHVAALATGLAIMAKGSPAIFVLVFAVGYCAIEKQWKPMRDFVLCGAPLTLLIVAAPWFFYVRSQGGSEIFVDELNTTIRGTNHWGSPLLYLPAMLLATAPWCGFTFLSVGHICKKFRSDANVRWMTIWLLAILVPLCINGNKQTHYLLPLTPPLMLLTARYLATLPPRWTPASISVLVCTLLIAVAAAVAVPIVARREHHQITTLDWIVCAAVATAALGAIAAAIKDGAGESLRVMLCAVAVLMPLVVGGWISRLPLRNSRDVAADIREKFGDGPYLFYGKNISLPLCFNLHAAIPSAETDEELIGRTSPGAVVIAITKNNIDPPQLPRGYAHQLHVDGNEETLDCYQTQP